MWLFLFLFFHTLFFLILLFSINLGSQKIVANYPKSKVLSLVVAKPVLIDAIIQYAGIVFQNEGLTKNVKWQFSNYNQKHLKSGAYYIGSENTGYITIYIRKLDMFEEIIQTVLHEMTHHRQYIQDKKNYDRNYNRYKRKLGYYDNPYEIEARIIAGENWIPCLNYLIERRILEYK